MLFREVIINLEATSEKMHQTAAASDWDQLALLDKKRNELMDMLGSADEHELTDSIRQRIARIIDLDNSVVQLIQSAKNKAKMQQPSEQQKEAGLHMYSQGHRY